MGGVGEGGTGGCRGGQEMARTFVRVLHRWVGVWCKNGGGTDVDCV